MYLKQQMQQDARAYDAICKAETANSLNMGLSRPTFWKPMCLLSTSKGLATTNYQLTGT